MRPISCASVGKYGNGSQAPKPLNKPSIGSESSPTSSAAFWTVSPNPNCVTCYDEANKATGMVAEKGGSYVRCPDCSTGTCLDCLFCGDMIARGEPIWCAKHGKHKSPFQVCSHHQRR